MVNFTTAIQTALPYTVAAGTFIFSIYAFRKRREREAALDLAVEATVHEIGSSALKVIDISITVVNRGKAAAFTPMSKVADCICRIRKISPIRAGLEILWEDAKDLVPPIIYMEGWESASPESPFVFEPGESTNFHRVVTTDAQGPFWIRAKLVDAGGYTWKGEQIVVAAAKVQPNLATR